MTPEELDLKRRELDLKELEIRNRPTSMGEAVTGIGVAILQILLWAGVLIALGFFILVYSSGHH